MRCWRRGICTYNAANSRYVAALCPQVVAALCPQVSKLGESVDKLSERLSAMEKRPIDYAWWVHWWRAPAALGWGCLAVAVVVAVGGALKGAEPTGGVVFNVNPRFPPPSRKFSSQHHTKPLCLNYGLWWLVF